MTIDEARHRLQTYLRELPDEWDGFRAPRSVLDCARAHPPNCGNAPGARFDRATSRP